MSTTSLNQGCSFGHSDFRTIRLGSDKIASARLSVGQAPKYGSDTFRTIGQFGQLGSYFGHSARLG